MTAAHADTSSTNAPAAPLILVDGSSFLFRAFHALPPLTAPDGRPTGAIHGVINMLMRLRREQEPTRMAVVFDAKGPTFREAMYPAYKANRPPLPEDLRVQIEPVHALVRALGFPLLCVDGVEADDVIGTLLTQARARGWSVWVATADKDFAQLVTEGVTLVNTMSNTQLDTAGVQEKYGVRPDQFIDYLALVGDAVDNVPGVPGCGPKTAAKWLQHWGTLDALLAHAESVTGKVGEALRAARDFLPIGRDLVTIRTDCALPVTIDALTLTEPDSAAVTALAIEFGLNTLRRQFAAADAADQPAAASPESLASPMQGALALSDTAPYHTVLTAAAWQTWLHALSRAPIAAFDTETDSLDLFTGRIVGISLAVPGLGSAYVPFDFPEAATVAHLSADTVLGSLKGWLEDAAAPKVLQNAKFDSHMLANHGIRLAGVLFDTMLESYVLDATATRHDMDALAARYLHRQTISFESIAGKGAAMRRFPEIPLDQAAPYAAEDAEVTLQLHDTLWPRLTAQADLQQVYEEIERPLIPVLVAMERAGVRVDAAELARQGAVLAERIEALAAQAHAAAGRAFNLGSTKQIKEILFDELALPVGKKTPKGEPSTDEEALQELTDAHPLPALILAWRSLTKLTSTYIDRLPQEIHPQTGRVHSAFHQAVTATGRLSSSNPNLQNIPIRSEEGRRIRQAFVAETGHRLIAADYSQIELRIMAHLSGDERLCAAFAAGEDIHRATAAEVFAVAERAVTDNQRRAAKAINFGLIYGMSAFGLAKQIGVGRAEAQDYIDRYFTRYPGVAAYMDAMRQQARAQGFVSTVFGRRLYLPDIHSRNAARRQYAERTAINAPMQGTAADIIKRAMIRLYAELVATGQARLILQVHDELVFEVLQDRVDAVLPMIEAGMREAATLAVPLEVGLGVGQSWAAAH